MTAPTIPVTTTSTLYRGGRVHSPADPFATALLVEDGMVRWIGSDDASAGFDADETVDLRGALVTPAFVDAHVHVTATGLTLGGLELGAATSRQAVLDAVATHASGLAADAVVLGHGWDETRWEDRQPPTAAELDRAARGRKTYLSRIDVHSAAVSTSLLTATAGLPGLTGYRADGVVSLDAHQAVRALALGSVSTGQRAEAQRRTRRQAASLGIAAICECGGPGIAGEDDFTGLLRLAHEEVGTMVFGYWGELFAAEKARALGAVGAGGDLFADGTLGSRTAHLRESYVDTAGTGHGYLTCEQVTAHLLDCAEHGMQAGFHAIGDAALTTVLAGFAAAAAEVGTNRIRAGRHRIEHAEMLDRGLIAGMVEFGLVASVQPAFDTAWGGTESMYAIRLGTERAATLNPFAALAGTGVPLALGSDAPVTPLDPWGAVRAAAYHQTAEQRISVRAAFAAHTRGGWRALRRDDTGALVPGAPAHLAVWEAEDLVVAVADERVSRWSTDPRAAVPGLPDLTPGAPTPSCRRTVVGGVTTFDQEEN
jgi:predicted amidohydrolase YtcJ